MHPLLRILLANQVLALLLLSAFALAVRPSQFSAIALMTFVFSNAIGGSVGLLFWVGERSGYLEALSRPARFAVRSMIGALGTVIGVGLALGGLHLLIPSLRPDPSAVLRLGGFALLVTAAMTLLHFTLGHLKARVEEKAIELQKLREIEAQTRLATLQTKVNPHFLFNTLNTLLNLVRSEPDRAEELILRLSELYRRILTLPEGGTLPLSEELELVREYLSIEQVRLGSRLAFEIHCTPEASGVELPPLLVEPLVQNAVKHGLSAKPEGGTIRIRAEREGGRLGITVEDDGAGSAGTATGCGFGLENLRQRLRLHYHQRARLEAGAREGGGYRARIEVPA